MPVYQNQGPQQYAMYKQSRKDDWIRQLLQMFMMKQQQGKRDERWEREQTQREKYQQGTLDYYEHLKQPKPEAPPKVPEKMQVAQLLMKYNVDTPEGKAIRKAYSIKTQEDEDRAMEVFKEKEDYKAKLRPKTGAGGISAGGKAVQARWEANQESTKTKTAWTRQKAFITSKTKRLVTERERMVKGLDPENKKFLAEQQPRIANMDKAIAEMDRIDSLLSTGGLLPPEEFTKAKNLITNMEAVKNGVYDFDTGKSMVVGTISEAGLTKDMAIATSPTTGERLALVNGQWKRIIKKK